MLCWMVTLFLNLENFQKDVISFRNLQLKQNHNLDDYQKSFDIMFKFLGSSWTNVYTTFIKLAWWQKP